MPKRKANRQNISDNTRKLSADGQTDQAVVKRTRLKYINKGNTEHLTEELIQKESEQDPKDTTQEKKPEDDKKPCEDRQENEQRDDAGYLKEPSLRQTIETDLKKRYSHEKTWLGVIGSELFVLSDYCHGSQFIVFCLTTNQRLRRLKLQRSCNLYHMLSCNVNKCLYINYGLLEASRSTDDSMLWPLKIVRLDTRGMVIRSWDTESDGRSSLSLTYDYNLLVVSYYGHTISEYTPDGQLISKTKVDVGHLNYAVKLTNGHFVISYRSEISNDGVMCLADGEGNVIKAVSVNQVVKESISQMISFYLTLDINDVIVMSGNNKVTLLLHNLQYKRDLICDESPHPELIYGNTDICIDKERRLLIVAGKKRPYERSSHYRLTILVYDI